MKRTTFLSGRIVSIIIATGFFTLFSCQSPEEGRMTVMEGHFRQSFTETGDLAALKSSAVAMPRINYQYGYEFKIVEMLDNGTKVKKGDTVVRLDDSSVQKYIISNTEALDTEKATANKQKVESKNALQELESNLRLEQATYDLKKLELERVKYDTEHKRKIKELEFEQATIRMNKLKRQLKLKPQMNELDRKIQQIKIDQKVTDLQGAREALKRLALTCPESGLFQVGSNMFIYPPIDLKVGDAVFQGALIARIPDVSRMRVNTFVNEADFTKIRRGSKVIVRLDALPTTPFHGKITYINKTCTAREKEKVFRVHVEIDESDLRLKPGMTVSCEFICYEGQNEMFAPNRCVFKENGHAYVFVAKGNNYKKVEIKTGRSNNLHTLISGNVLPGQKLIPFEKILNKQNL